jgi:RNA polymerase sigma factor (sigma-70 family)
VDTRQWRDTIAAAQDGDRRALDELGEVRLPLVYNIVGRALNGHADVDDVVQETMLRAVDNLGSLRAPDSFRSWLVAIARV